MIPSLSTNPSLCALFFQRLGSRLYFVSRPAASGALFLLVMTLFSVNVPAAAGCVTAPADNSWQNTVISNQTGTFTAQFDATPSASPINAVVGLSNGAQTAY